MSIVDIVLILIFVVTIIMSAVRGFVKSISGIVAWILAGAIALSFCSVVSEKIYETLFQNKVIEMIDERINVSDDAAELVNVTAEVLEELPDFVIKAAESIGIDVSALEKKAETFSADERGLAVSLEENTVGPIIRAALKAVSFVLMLIILSALLSLLFRPIEKIAEKLPLVKQANKLLGGVLGLVKAAVLVIVLSMILELFAGFGNSEFSKAVAQSEIVKTVVESSISNALFI